MARHVRGAPHPSRTLEYLPESRRQRGLELLRVNHIADEGFSPSAG